MTKRLLATELTSSQYLHHTYCWRSLNACLDHQHCTKNGRKQYHMCRICFIIHLVPLVHGNIFVCRSLGQNGDKYTHWRQVDVVGGLGATWAHQLTPQGRRPAPPSATLALAASPIRGSCSTSSPMRWFKSVCINGHDGVVLDPWVHYHGLGALQLTSKLISYPNLCTCCLHHRLWEPTKTLQSKGGKIKGRPAPSPCRLMHLSGPITSTDFQHAAMHHKLSQASIPSQFLKGPNWLEGVNTLI
jgi:hypothetical protein